jgi:hypothetical protein
MDRKKHDDFFPKFVILKKFCFIPGLLFLLMGSCVMDPEQYVMISIINNTNEDLLVNNGALFSFIYTIPKQSAYTILGIKNTPITLVGKDTKRHYGSRSFYSDGTWPVP